MPDASLYKDITATTAVALQDKDVNSYLNSCEDEMDKKAKQLYEER